MGNIEDTEELGKELITPDYCSDDDLDDDFDDELDDETITSEKEIEEDDSILEEIYKEQEKTNEKNMTQSPFAAPGWGDTTSWRSPSSTPSWAVASKPVDQNPWSSSNNNLGGWRAETSPIGGLGSRPEINRKKKVIFCDLLDCITETYQSEGRPGLRPRDIYDFKFRFDVWQKIAAFNPEKVFIMIPQNLLPASANGLNSWEISLGYFCCCLSAFLRLPDENCQILLQSRVGQRKEEIMKTTISQLHNISLDDIIQIGIYSGLNGLSDMDKIAAESCGIDYIDLYQLLNSI